MDFSSPFVIGGLSLAALVTSIISASSGFMGGTILLTGMAQIMPVATAIPLHGVVQLWANSSRAVLLLKHIEKRVFAQFGIGALVGAFAAAHVVASVPPGLYSLILGVFVLVMVFLPKPKNKVSFPAKWVIVGFVTAFMGVFVGAVGTFLGVMFLREDFSKEQIVGTQAVCQTLVHALKIIVFVSNGFLYGPWTLLLVCMLTATILGSYVGVQLLKRIPQAAFLKIFRWILLALALRLVWQGL